MVLNYLVNLFLMEVCLFLNLIQNYFYKIWGLLRQSLKNPNVFGKTYLRSQFIATPTAITLSNLKLGLDNSTLSGHAHLVFSPQSQSQFNFNLNQIDLSSYMTSPPKTKKTKAKPQTSTTTTKVATSTTEILPIKTLRKLNIKGQVTIGKLAYNTLTMTNLKLNLSANNGLIRAAPNSANLFGGQWLSNIALNVQSNMPVFQINEAINNVQVARLLNALSINNKIQLVGTANLKATVSTFGNTAPILTKNLNGNGQFAITKGAIKGINIGYQLNRALAIVNRQPTSAQPANDETPFGSLTGTVQINNGVISNKDLLLNSQAMQVTGKGYANLITQELNYDIEASAIQGKVNPKIYDLQKKIGGSVPIQIAGTFDSFKVYPNTPVILKNLATSYVKKNTQKIKQQINEKVKGLGNQLQKGLQNLFR